MRTLCLGEALVDLVCEHPVDGVTDADSFRPHFGGAAANVCVTAARRGARVALAGGAGDDAWGRWLRERLGKEGVDRTWFSLVEGAQTPVAFVTVDVAGEPTFAIYGDGIQLAVEAVAARLSDAIADTDALVFASNTLVGTRERKITLAARKRALALGRRVIFDPNLRMHRWISASEATDVVGSCIPEAFLVKCNATEARLLTGQSEPDRAAGELIARGARNVIVTLGADGAILRGEATADAPGVFARVLNATGAGDAFLGTVLAVLSASDCDCDTLAEALPVAVREAAAATERWGAI